MILVAARFSAKSEKMYQNIRADTRILQGNKYIRSRCACTNCDNIVQAYTPSKVIDKGIAGPGLLADIFVNKFSNHLPAYRQSQMFERE